MRPRVLVAGIGNIFLSDDGFGVEVIKELEHADLPPWVQIADYGIAGMHLAYDLMGGYDTTILLDATPHGRPPGTLSLIEADTDDSRQRPRSTRTACSRTRCSGCCACSAATPGGCCSSAASRPASTTGSGCPRSDGGGPGRGPRRHRARLGNQSRAAVKEKTEV